MFDASVPMMKQMVAILVRCKKVGFLHGRPGIAKSAAMKQVAGHLSKVTGNKYVVNDCRLSQKEPTDLGGLPFAQDGFTSYLPPKFMPREGFGILFLDEIPRAERPTQQAAFQLIYDREFGEYKLPDGYSMMLAGNLGDEDMTNGNESDSAFCNRVAHIRVNAIQKDWEKYMSKRSNDYDDDIEAYTFIENPDKETLVVDFVKGHESHFMGKECMGAFPTPRSWEMLEDVLEHIGGSKADPILANAFAIAFVGEAAGIAFSKWFREREEYKPTLIVDNWNKQNKDRYIKLSEGYKQEVVDNFENYVNKMTKFTDKQKKNICDFMFDNTVLPEETAGRVLNGWSNNAQVIGFLQSMEPKKFLRYFKPSVK